MFRVLRLVPVWLVALVGLTQASLAQSSTLSAHEVVPRLLQQMRINDIAAEPVRIVVRASRLHSDGRIAPVLLIVCDRSRPEQAYVAVRDHALKTDDRQGVEPGFCDVLLALVRQHRDAQQR